MAEYLRLKEANCKNCYKCIRHCPIKSIRFSGNQAHIISDECILCGQCFVVCPQDAKVICSDLETARMLVSGSAPVVVSLAPSFAAFFPDVGIEGMRDALSKLGFDLVEETAIGATVVKREYDRLVDEGEQDIIISSCCPSVNLLIQKYYPEVLPYLAKVVSPMQAHCRDIKSRMPGAKTIFIGPCISKKQEADLCKQDVDCVLTFEELSEWLCSEGILPEAKPDVTAGGRARLFPTAGGIIKSMDRRNRDYSYMVIDGPENCIAALRDISTGSVSKCFIEMSSCTGSCIGGPIISKYRHIPVSGLSAVERYAGTEDFDVKQPSGESLLKAHPLLGSAQVYPNEAQLKDILRQMGKTRPEDELNCASCGYNSCREKAIAVYQGKADMTMCTPFLRDKAEDFNGSILRNSPNGIIVLNDLLEVQQINPEALRIFNLRSASDVVGDQLNRIMDPAEFLNVKNSGVNIHDKRIYLAEYGRYVELTIVLDRTYRTLLTIIRDVTVEEEQRRKKEAIARKTMETTDKVVEKQMRVVQEIASLLGETTAETKIALTKLKESLKDE